MIAPNPAVAFAPLTVGAVRLIAAHEAPLSAAWAPTAGMERDVFSFEVIDSARLTAAAIDELQQLGMAAYDDAFTTDDLAHALGGDHVVVRDGDGRWLAHAAVVPRLLRIGEQDVEAGFVEAVAVLPDRQTEGLGTRVMAAIGRIIVERYAIGALSTGEHEFYERLGWEAWQGPSFVIGGDGSWRRTADEDDGIMILRTAASRYVDRTLPIACHDRPGDAW